MPSVLEYAWIAKTTRGCSKRLTALKRSGPMTPPKHLEMSCCPWSRPWRKSKKIDHDVHGFEPAPCAKRLTVRSFLGRFVSIGTESCIDGDREIEEHENALL